jgi:ATP-dependent RNA helicase DDX21
MERILELVKTQKQEGGAPDHQTLLFSATMPDWIKEAVRKYMKPDKITLDLIGTDKQKTSATVKHCCLTSRWQNRAAVLGDIVAVYGRGNAGRTIIFVETKGECNELVMNEKLVAMGAQCLHGDIAQNQRETTMAGFRKGLFSCLITTNVCARGVDIPEVDLVINCEPPKDVESYIHRSGRTGRAGRSGTCVTFYKSTQENLIQNITRRAGVEFTYIGAPQAKDVVAARAFETLEIMKDGLDEQVLEYFGDAAKELLNYYNNDGIKALSGALAMICQVTKPLPSRSLLTANEGFVSVMFQVDKPIRHVGYVKSMLQRNHPGVGYDATPIWRMTIDSMGVIADISEDKVQIDNGQISLGGIPWNNDNGVVACIPTELPELQDRPDMARDNFRGGSRGGRGNYGNSRGNYGNSRGGYGNSRGGYGNSRGASRGRGRY